MTPRAFLDLLWQYKSEEQHILIWTLQDKRSHWFRDVGKAAEFVATVSASMDVYVGVGLSKEDHGPVLRCKSEEVSGTGLMIKHVDLESGTLHIQQRNWRGDIDDPKTNNSKRTLALGSLTARYRTWIDGLKRKGPNDWVFPQEDDLKPPRWDSGVRQAMTKAAKSIKQSADEDDPGLDFPGFGPHSLRRANITWRQEVGGSATEASKIAGHSSTAITDEYTLVGLKRQDEFTRRIQEKRAKAARKVK